MKKILRLMALVIPALLVGCNKTQYTAYGLAGNTLIEFDTKDPSKVSATVTLGTVTSSSSTITDDSVAKIFFGTDGTLYCTTIYYELCTIDLGSGDVTLVTGTATTGSDLITLFNQTDFNPDFVIGNTLISGTVTSFDPVNSTIRVFATDAGTGSAVPNQGKPDNLNFNIDPLSLAPDDQAGDTSLVYASDDSTSSGKNPTLVSIAYSSPFSGATSTTLYGIDSSTGNLVRVGDVDATSASTSVHDGQVHTIGPLGVATAGASLAIEAKNGDAFVTVGTKLYSIDLGNGSTSSIGTISDGSKTITSLAFSPSE